ncbi:MAG TPA: hypothetical protein VGC09_23015 [Rhodopila sp.]
MTVERQASADDWRARQIAEDAAQKAVEQTFRLLGIDLRDQGGVNALRDDLSYVRRQREARESLGAETRKGVIAGILQGAAWAVMGAITAMAGYFGIVPRGHP